MSPVGRLRRVRLSGGSIEKRYGRVAALRGIDFEILPGESVAVLGANGAGKSSLLRILAGLSRPSAGRFAGHAESAVDGAQTHPARTPANRPGEERSREELSREELSREELRGAVGYVGHATLLYGELSARENLQFAARLHGLRPGSDQIDGILASFSLLDVAERRAGTFSRGMAQRLSIARAVVHDPGILLLDEPFTGLDEVSAEALSARLAEQRSNGRTLVLVTHDPRRAVELADRALILHQGVVRGTPARTPHASGSADPDGLGADATPFEVESLRQALARLAREAGAETRRVAGAAR